MTMLPSSGCRKSVGRVGDVPRIIGAVLVAVGAATVAAEEVAASMCYMVLRLCLSPRAQGKARVWRVWSSSVLQSAFSSVLVYGERVERVGMTSTAP